MDEAKLPAWWWSRQGLDGSLSGRTCGETLSRSGWARSVGGSGPYLTLFSRAGSTRERADAAVAAQEIHELPAARGCTYVVPAADFALALRAGQPFTGGEMKVAAKLGVTEKEIGKLCDAIVKALAKAPLEPDQLREATGGAARSLGAEGLKKGLSTTLPVALGRLQSLGAIRRIPTNGRLDQQRYRYARWTENPLAKSKLTLQEAGIELARRYFRWTGPATLAEFQWFSGMGVKASQAAVAPLGLVPLEKDSPRLLFPDDLEALNKYRAPGKPQYSLVSSLDAITLLRRDLKGLLDAKDHARSVHDGKKMQPLGAMSDPPSHCILDRGRIVGLWEFDTAAGKIVWTCFGKKDAAMEKEVLRTEAYVRGQLGDARSFSLDSPKSRAPRIEALRKAH
ncbi:MAG: winged helix DNA-binding domain-containing protein [Acidimicrobiia bacterium]|nr:winged helix DNA-binding domain-containing protein [Acidimicrobiia bacterium]